MAESYDEAYERKAAGRPIPTQKDFVYSSRQELDAANIKLARDQLERTTDPVRRAELQNLIDRFQRPNINLPKGAPPATPELKEAIREGMTQTDWFPVQGVRKTRTGKEAFINGRWLPVEQTGHMIQGGQAVRSARFGRYAPDVWEQLKFGAERGLGGLTYELGKSLATVAPRIPFTGMPSGRGPDAGKALEAGERYELAQKYPQFIGTPYEHGRLPMVSGFASGVLTDPLTYAGYRGGALGMAGMGAVSGVGAQAAEQLRAGEFKPAEAGLAGVVGAGAGMAAGVGVPLALRGLGKVYRSLTGTSEVLERMTKDERAQMLSEILGKYNAKLPRPGEGIPDELAEQVNAELQAIAASRGQSGKRVGKDPGVKPKLKAKPAKTATEYVVSPEEGDLEGVLPGGRVEPRVGELPETPPPEFPPVKPEAVPPGTEPKVDLGQEVGPTKAFKGEVPIGIEPSGKPRLKGPPGAVGKQEGGITPMLAARLATTTAGAAIGAAADPEHPVEGALLGGAVGLAVPGLAKRIIAGGPATAMTLLAKRDPLLAKIAREPVDQAVANMATRGREIAQNYALLKSYALSPGDSELVVHAIQHGGVSLLPPNLQIVARHFSQLVDRLGTEAQQAGAIPNLGRNYVPQIWDTSDPATKAVLKRLGYDTEKEATREGFTAFTPFSLPRNIPSYDYGVRQLGMKPKTYDLAELYGMYAQSVNRSIENTKLLGMVKQLRDQNGRSLVAAGQIAPKGYVPLKDVPEMGDYRVHPEIAESLNFALGSQDLNRIERGLLGVSFAAKRLNVSYSGFHVKSLAEAYTLAGGNPFDIAAGAAARGGEKMFNRRINYESAIDAALKAYQTGGAGDSVDFLIRNGLVIKPPIEDVSKLKEFHKFLDDVIPVSGHVGSKVDQAFQDFTWTYMQTGMKIATGMRLFERELLKNPNRDPNGVAAEVSKFTNRLFGSLDWRREVEEIQNKWLYAHAADFASARGMAWQQIMMFAPDWTWSTFLSWAKAIPGVEPSKVTRELHQRYVATTTLAELTIANAINKQLSGHYLWENAEHRHPDRPPSVSDVVENMLYLDLGDGRHMNIMKHGLEVPHMMSDPIQFWMNKLGYVPKMAAELATNKEWLSRTWAPNIVEPGESYALRYPLHVLKGFTPFATQGLGGALGFPIYGMTEEQKAKAADEREQRRARAQE